MIRGSCLCGAAAFEAYGLIEFRNCHCSRCRKAHGADYAANIYVRPADFHWLRGEDKLINYRLPFSERFGNTFCRICGSPMPRAVQQRDWIVVPAGALDDDPGVRATYHIFVDSKAPWYDITDDLPQHAEYPPART
jgi:hypothetical protein